jgi:hypothetical protein
MLGLTAVYDTFTKNLFANNLTNILNTNPTDLPHGYDLYSSFYNFSCNFAITLWIKDQSFCQIEGSNFPFPKRNQSAQDERFKILFHEDARTRYARQGSPIYVTRGVAKFTHISI